MKFRPSRRDDTATFFVIEATCSHGKNDRDHIIDPSGSVATFTVEASSYLSNIVNKLFNDSRALDGQTQRHAALYRAIYPSSPSVA